MTTRVGQKSFESLIHAQPTHASTRAQSRSSAWIELTKQSAGSSSYAEVPLKNPAPSASDTRVVSALWRKV